MPNQMNIVDLSHFNADVDLIQAKASGVRAIIHKATQGVAFIDPTLRQRRLDAAHVAMLFGMYHFGTGADGVEQAEYFLDTTEPSKTDLLILDLEHNPQGPSMSLEEARAFVTHIQIQTGRWPGLYAGSYLKELLGSQADPVLANCWFWLAQYGPTPVVPANWKTWTLWQYTDGAQGGSPDTVPGIGRCDQSFYNGTPDNLTSFWLGK